MYQSQQGFFHGNPQRYMASGVAHGDMSWVPVQQFMTGNWTPAAAGTQALASFVPGSRSPSKSPQKSAQTPPRMVTSMESPSPVKPAKQPEVKEEFDSETASLPSPSKALWAPRSRLFLMPQAQAVRDGLNQRLSPGGASSNHSIFEDELATCRGSAGPQVQPCDFEAGGARDHMESNQGGQKEEARNQISALAAATVPLSPPPIVATPLSNAADAAKLCTPGSAGKDRRSDGWERRVKILQDEVAYHRNQAHIAGGKLLEAEAETASASTEASVLRDELERVKMARNDAFDAARQQPEDMSGVVRGLREELEEARKEAQCARAREMKLAAELERRVSSHEAEIEASRKGGEDASAWKLRFIESEEECAMLKQRAERGESALAEMQGELGRQGSELEAAVNASRNVRGQVDAALEGERKAREKVRRLEEDKGTLELMCAERDAELARMTKMNARGQRHAGALRSQLEDALLLERERETKLSLLEEVGMALISRLQERTGGGGCVPRGPGVGGGGGGGSLNERLDALVATACAELDRLESSSSSSSSSGICGRSSVDYKGSVGGKGAAPPGAEGEGTGAGTAAHKGKSVGYEWGEGLVTERERRVLGEAMHRA